MYLDLPLPTSLGALRILPVREGSVYVTGGSMRPVTIDGTDLVLNVRVTRSPRGDWRIAEGDFSAEQMTSAPLPAPATKLQQHQIQAAIINAVSSWASHHEPLLRYVEYAAILDRRIARAEQRLRQLTGEALAIQRASTALVRELADAHANLRVGHKPSQRSRPRANSRR